MSDSPTILFDSFQESRFSASWRFTGYIKTIIAIHSDEVREAVRQVEQEAALGRYAAGFVSYEAATALNPDLPAAPPMKGLPLVWFAVFQQRYTAVPETELVPSTVEDVLKPLNDREQYPWNIDREWRV